MNDLANGKIVRTMWNITRFILAFILAFYMLSVYGMEEVGIIHFVCGGLILFLTAFYIIIISGLIKTERSSFFVILILSVFFLVLLDRIVKATPQSDYLVLYEGANQIVDGTFRNRAIQKDDYFCFYNFQIGYAFYLSLLLRISHRSLSMVRIVRVFVLAFTNIVLYKTLRMYTTQRVSLCGTVIFIAWPYIYLGSGILNNQHEAILFEALAIYFFLKAVKCSENKPFFQLITCSFFLSVAVIMRPTAKIIVISIIIVCLLQYLTKKNTCYLIGGGIILVVYLVTYNSINQLFIMSGLAPYGLKTNNLWFKLLLGLTGTGITQQGTTDAEHTNLYYDLQYYGFDYDAYKMAAAAYMKQYILSGSLKLNFIVSKMIGFAGGYDNQYFFTGSSFMNDHPEMVAALNVAGKGIYFVLIAFSLIGSQSKRFFQKIENCLFAMIFIGYFASYILLECQTRYRFEQYYVLALMAVPMMAVIWRAIISFTNRLFEKCI